MAAGTQRGSTKPDLVPGRRRLAIVDRVAVCSRVGFTREQTVVYSGRM